MVKYFYTCGNAQIIAEDGDDLELTNSCAREDADRFNMEVVVFEKVGRQTACPIAIWSKNAVY